ncbi:MAG: hypothetical protein EPN33_12920 [Acidobacteria bacterium]|nr:MAG: hypothetical protein EPN33_12920 [Acidobacteriota bacterium]
MRMARSLLSLILTLGLALACVSVAAAQQPPQGGFPPFVYSARSRTVAVESGDATVTAMIPVFRKPGRGLPFSVGLTYNSNIYINTGSAFSLSNMNGWMVGPSYGQINNTIDQSHSERDGSGYCLWSTIGGFYYTDPSGAEHDFPGSYTTKGILTYPRGTCRAASGAVVTEASDGSGYRIDAGPSGSWSETDRHGDVIYPNGGNSGHVIEDSNGNYISDSVSGAETDWTDTTGAVVTKEIAESSGCTNPVDGVHYPSCTAIEVPEPGSSGYATYLLVENTIAANTSGYCSGISDYSGTVTVPVYLVLPEYASGTHWYYQFGYDGAARLNSITYPAGGVTTLSYGSMCTYGDGSVASVQVTENSGQNSGTTTYTRGTGSMTVARPDGSKTVVTYDAGGLPTDVKNYDTDSQTLLKEVAYTNTGGTPDFPSAAITYLNGIKVSERDTTFDSYGNLTKATDIDWARDASGATRRVTSVSYLYDTSPNIVDRPETITVQDGASNTYSQTAITYDNYASPSGLVASSGALNHNANFSASYTTRGNPTEVSRYSSSGAALDTYYRYEDTGNVVATDEPNGNLVSTSYGNCADSYPSSTSAPGGSGAATFGYDCGTGQLTSRTDQNGKTVSLGYDAYARLTGTSNPDGGGETLGYPSPTETQVSTKISGSLGATHYTLTDGYGATLFSQTPVPGGGCDTIEYILDDLGRATQVSDPYNETTCLGTVHGSGFTTAVLDGLGRPKSITLPDGSSTTSYAYTGSATKITPPGGTPARILERDGWGDLWKVCELSAQSGSSACGLAIGGSGFLTQYTYSPLGLLNGVSQHGESRSFAFDWLGRITSETTPESGTNSFTFDSSGTCGTAAGSLVERVDNAGNVTCYAHDGWGRVTAITYPSGPNAAATPAKTFVYDGATVDGAGMTDAAGRLAEAYTGPASAKITDEGFGYDAMGRPSEFYEATPHSGGYYVMGESWWLDGQPQTLTQPGIPAVTYNPDTAGRITSVTAASGQNPVGNVTYFPGNLVNAVTYGSGDYDSYVYNNDQRMTQYTLDINGSNDIGKLGWNGNGTLASLDITDPFATGDTQNCTYTQDDLGRLSAASCGGEWSQTFSPDTFGNQSAPSGGSSPLVASFNGKNQFASVSGFVPNYNADGDLLDDPVGQVRNDYAWDADGKLIGENGMTQTFDALGRMVENSSAGEALYTPSGAQYGNLQGQSTVIWYVIPLPGSAAAVYRGSALAQYEHADWQRSWRLQSTPSRGFDGDLAYSPYGAYYAGTGGPAFTGVFLYEAGPYQFPYRAESPALKRWLSPDPAGLAAVNPANPQTWDAYAYVDNQPLSSTDPTGLVRPADLMGWLDSEIAGILDGGGAGGGCQINGADAGCGLTEAILASGSGAQCPNNNCDPGGPAPFQCLQGVCGYMTVQYASTHDNEVDGALLTNSQYQQYLLFSSPGQTEAQRDRLLAGLAADGYGATQISALPEFISGGNANFACKAGFGCPADGRYGYGVHVEGPRGSQFMHDDTNSPYIGPFSFWGVDPWALLEHFAVDVFYGSLCGCVIGR